MDLKLFFFFCHEGRTEITPPFLSRVPRTVYAPKREEITGQRNCLRRTLKIVQHILRSNQEEWYG
jgi:hypothetical protein